MIDEQLAPHFWLREFLASETAARLGRTIEPTSLEVDNLRELCMTLLEPIRVKLGRSIVITSGLRPAWLNAAIGGSSISAHMKGLAADIKVVGMTPKVFSKWVSQNAVAEGWPIDQCILEFGSWTHLSTAAAPRGQYLTALKQGGSTVYRDGIV
jgi:zinc D-Ala-D-Ala carboxypeptidase